MDRHQLLLSAPASLLIFALSTLASPAIAQAGCSSSDTYFGTCTGAQTNSSSVDVWGNRTAAGDQTAPSSVGSSGADATAIGWWTAPDTPFSVVPQRSGPTFNNFCDISAYLNGPLCPVAPVAAPPPPAVSPVTLRDLANFTPEQPSLSLQPNGWTVIGVETNFIANTGQHVVGGRLFGALAEVRFTPQAFDWSYGDGSSASTSEQGAPWAQLGVKEFSRTATSHRYQSLGTFTPRVTVRFGVEYRVGGGAWIPVRGQVSADAPAETVFVQSADTVLVTGACTPGRPALGC
jgi:hypothetical protein